MTAEAQQPPEDRTAIRRAEMRDLWRIYDQSLGVGGFVQEAQRRFPYINRMRLEDLWLAFDLSMESTQ
jgi:hypothetical protein